MQRSRFGFWLLFAALLVSDVQGSASFARTRWVGSWASAQMLLDPKAVLQPASDDITIRQLVRTTLGGNRVRLRISNAFGKAPLTIEGVDIARATMTSSSRIDAASDRSVTFAGMRSITIPAGAEYVSDAVPMVVPALATLAISIHVHQLPKLETGHPGSRATSYVASGDQLKTPELSGASTIEGWYFISGVDVDAAPAAAVIAVLGDSITDGHGVVTNSNTRWPDFLANRLQSSPRTRSFGVLNLGIGGNRLVEDGIGPNALARFGRDVLERSGVKYLVVLEGVNDLGVLTRDAPASPDAHRALVARMLGTLTQIISLAHDHGIKVVAGTIMPYGASGYYHPGALSEADRAAINTWFRNPGHVDALVDFDAIMRDPAHPERLRSDLDSGDGLHPSAAGYRLMGYSVPLSLFSHKGHR